MFSYAGGSRGTMGRDRFVRAMMVMFLKLHDVSPVNGKLNSLLT